jgi:cyclophilin family peptidyl-prolyl cis-trans isomerase
MRQGLVVAAALVVVSSVLGTIGYAQKAPKLKPGIYAHFDTSEGQFTVRFYPDAAPKTVENFVGLAEGRIDTITGGPGKSKPYYDGLTFHRIVPGFVIQGGDPTGSGSGGPGYRFKDEISPKLKFSRPGLMAMANSGPNANGSQFFITLAPIPSLNGKHTIFGEVVDGMNVVKKIAAVKRQPNTERPATPVVMKKVTIERVG